MRELTDRFLHVDLETQEKEVVERCLNDMAAVYGNMALRGVPILTESMLIQRMGVLR